MAPVKKTPAKRKTAAKKTVKKPLRQTGKTTVREDKLRKAKKPGKRVSKTGKVYYERRANRSDIGKLLGTANVFPTKAKATAFAKEKNATARTYKYVVALYPASKGGDGKAHIVRKVAKRGLGVTRGFCVRQNPDGSTTTYGESMTAANPCPGGRRKLTPVTIQAAGQVAMRGTKPRRKTVTAKQKTAQSKFAVNSRKAQQLVKSGKAKTLKAAWATLKKK